MATYKVKGIKAARVGYISAGNIVFETIPFGTELALNGDVSDVTFEGDGQIERLYYDAEISGTISADKFKTEVLQRIYNKTPVVAGLPAGVASRQYFGTQDELAAGYVELQVDLDAVEDATGVAKQLRMDIFKVKAGPYVQPNIGHRTKMGMQITWTAIRTATDIDDAALPSVPTGGAVYSIDVLT
jgi:hypothetical protein